MYIDRVCDVEVVLMRDVVHGLAQKLVLLRWKMSAAESCTGGLISARCTDVSGSSQWFERGFVTYSNDSKSELLGVDPLLIEQHGAVSLWVAEAMAKGALERSKADVSLAVTGIAGPGGGSAEKPVGSVWIAWCVKGLTTSELKIFSGNRTDVRTSACSYALDGLLKRVQSFDNA